MVLDRQRRRSSSEQRASADQRAAHRAEAADHDHRAAARCGWKPRHSGLMKDLNSVYMPPAMPAKTAEIAKALCFIAFTSMPKAAATCRSRGSRASRGRTASGEIHLARSSATGSRVITGNAVGSLPSGSPGARPAMRMPSGPPVTFPSQLNTHCVASPKAKVASAR